MRSLVAGTVGISVWNGRAVVVRYEQEAGGITWAPASNWEDLEDAALEAVEAQGGWRTLSGHYVCPDALGQLAVFPENAAG